MASNDGSLSRGIGQLTEASININTATTTAVVSAENGMVTRLYKMVLNCGASQTLDIKNGSTSLTGGVLTFAAGGGIALDFDGTPWFTTSGSAALNFVTTTTGQLSGRIYYTKTREL
jgi:hypothetical protein